MNEKITKDGFFFITAADHRNSLKKIVGSGEEIKRIKKRIAKILSPHSSGFLVDPIYGQEAINFVKCGLLLSREKSGFIGDKKNRKTELLKDWNVKKLKEIGADAVKLLIYYNPEKSSREYQEKLVKKVAEECKKEKMPFLCEFTVYDSKEKDKFIIKSAETISKLGPDIIKTEAPSNLKDCKKLSKKISVPWVVLSGGEEYEKFKNSVKIATKGGASGFAGGRAIWQDTFEDEKLLKKISVERLKELSEIVKNYGNPL
ncbi:MAG: DUF2090 domain-containing protein [Candidatus Aenigmarchaeota archaeon]|nr:DUF2090 domain-containing protein [Candidatus Aenigmarchaeota archaeon]